LARTAEREEVEEEEDEDEDEEEDWSTRPRLALEAVGAFVSTSSSPESSKGVVALNMPLS
jgi:hypothetical protein